MTNILRFFVGLFILILFSQCNSTQTPNNSASANKVVNDSCCKKTNQTDGLKSGVLTSMKSEITCPKCGHKKVETLPTDVCQLSYTCEKCGTVMHPKEGDCCVFCTYGDHKCPSKQ